MTCCSANEFDNNNSLLCPSCGKVGHKIELKTLKSLLKISLFEIKGTQYFFCSTASCEVVYYEKDNHQIFGENDISEKVYQKHFSEDDVKVCYCFNYTLSDIRKDRNDKGFSEIYNHIVTGTKVGLCACDLKNPDGKCCLSNVKKIIQSK